MDKHQSASWKEFCIILADVMRGQSRFPGNNKGENLARLSAGTVFYYIS
jgi:hypothetical protein